jgi:hypothetical protein
MLGRTLRNYNDPDAYMPPPHLSPAARDWSKQIVAEYDLESQHVHLLTLCCEAADRGTLARKALAEHGLTYLDRFGWPHARHCPQCHSVARLCRELDL